MTKYNITKKIIKKSRYKKTKYKKLKTSRKHKFCYTFIKGVKKGGGTLNINIKPNFEGIPDATNYESIYIGIGAKYNENYPEDIENTVPYQLMPNFLTRKSLIIIIDTFSEEELAINIDIIKQQYSHNKNTDIDDFDVFIINHNLDFEISNKIIDFLSTRENTKTNLWICNYVIFLSPEPKPTELEIEQGVNQNCKYIAEANDNKLIENVYTWIGKDNFPFFLANNPNIGAIILRPLKTSKRPTKQQLTSIRKNILSIK